MHKILLSALFVVALAVSVSAHAQEAKPTESAEAQVIEDASQKTEEAAPKAN